MKELMQNHYKYILTVVDLFSKYVYLEALTSKKQLHVEAAMQRILDALARDGLPKPSIMQADNAKEFKSTKSWFADRDITLIHSDAYSPNSQGQVERMNGTVKKLLTKFRIQYQTNNWPKLLPLIANNINTSISETTGYTPYQLHVVRDQENSTDAALHIKKNAVKLLERRGIQNYGEVQRGLKSGDCVRLSQQALINKSLITTDKRPTKKTDLFFNWTEKIYHVNQVVKMGKMEVDDEDLEKRVNNLPDIARISVEEIPGKWFFSNQIQLIPPHIGAKVRITSSDSDQEYEVVRCGTGKRKREDGKYSQYTTYYLKGSDQKYELHELTVVEPNIEQNRSTDIYNYLHPNKKQTI